MLQCSLHGPETQSSPVHKPSKESHVKVRKFSSEEILRSKPSPSHYAPPLVAEAPHLLQHLTF